MLTVENLSMRYKDAAQPVLEDISFSCESGEILSIIGLSGSGKSSLLNILAGNVKNYGGRVSLGGAAIDYKSMYIGLIAQDYGLLPWKTVYGNIVLPLKIKRLSVDPYKEKIEYIMSQLQISELRDRFPNRLSGGEKQRTAIARAFVLDMDLLLMDEPFSALDNFTREQCQRLFLNIWSRKKPITLFVTHSIEEAVYLGKRILLLSPSPGRIIDIIDNPVFEAEFTNRSIDPRGSLEFHNFCTEIRARWNFEK